MNFRGKLRASRDPLITFTLTPPSQADLKSELQEKLDFIARLQDAVSVDAINIPQIINEQRNERVTQYNPKLDPMSFAREIRKTGIHSPELILDRIVVEQPWSEQRAWYAEALSEFGNVLLVGGESSQIEYPGPAVHESADLVKDSCPNHDACTIGAITIPSRRHHNPQDRHRDEPQKLIRKGSHGVDYFMSQVIYESQSSINLLRDYASLATASAESFKPIILSFAPISAEKDLRFLRWWDVSIPSDVEKQLLSSRENIFERSIEICGQILVEVLNFIRAENVMLRIGINIEHVSMRNLTNAIELGKRLFRLVEQHS